MGYLPKAILQYARDNDKTVDWAKPCSSWHTPDSTGSSPFQRALIRATDEVAKTFVSIGNKNGRRPVQSAWAEIKAWRWQGDPNALGATPFQLV